MCSVSSCQSPSGLLRINAGSCQGAPYRPPSQMPVSLGGIISGDRLRGEQHLGLLPCSYCGWVAGACRTSPAPPPPAANNAGGDGRDGPAGDGPDGGQPGDRRSRGRGGAGPRRHCIPPGQGPRPDPRPGPPSPWPTHGRRTGAIPATACRWASHRVRGYGASRLISAGESRSALWSRNPLPPSGGGTMGCLEATGVGVPPVGSEGMGPTGCLCLVFIGPCLEAPASSPRRPPSTPPSNSTHSLPPALGPGPQRRAARPGGRAAGAGVALRGGGGRPRGRGWGRRRLPGIRSPKVDRIRLIGRCPRMLPMEVFGNCWLSVRQVFGRCSASVRQQFGKRFQVCGVLQQNHLISPRVIRPAPLQPIVPPQTARRPQQVGSAKRRLARRHAVPQARRPLRPPPLPPPLTPPGSSGANSSGGTAGRGKRAEQECRKPFGGVDPHTLPCLQQPDLGANNPPPSR